MSASRTPEGFPVNPEADYRTTLSGVTEKYSKGRFPFGVALADARMLVLTEAFFISKTSQSPDKDAGEKAIELRRLRELKPVLEAFKQGDVRRVGEFLHQESRQDRLTAALAADTSDISYLRKAQAFENLANSLEGECYL